MELKQPWLVCFDLCYLSYALLPIHCHAADFKACKGSETFESGILLEGTHHISLHEKGELQNRIAV